MPEYLETEPPLEYPDYAGVILVGHALVHHDGTITVTFKGEAGQGEEVVCALCRRANLSVVCWIIESDL